jgi:hypothetical protein
MENLGSGDVPEYVEYDENYDPHDYNDPGDVTDILNIDVADLVNSTTVGEHLYDPGGYAYTSMEPESSPVKPAMEATENGGVLLNSRDAAVLIGQGLEKAATLYDEGSHAGLALGAMRDKAADYVRLYDEATAANEDITSVPEPLRFDPDEHMGAAELERVLDKAITIGVYGTSDAEADAALFSPEAELARNMRNGYEVSKLTPELKALYGIGEVDPDPVRLLAAIADRRQRAQMQRETGEHN